MEQEDAGWEEGCWRCAHFNRATMVPDGCVWIPCTRHERGAGSTLRQTGCAWGMIDGAFGLFDMNIF